MGAKHAKWFVTSAKTTGWLRETELVPKTQGIAKSLKEIKFAMGLAQARQGAAAGPAARRQARRRGARALRPRAGAGRDGAAGIVQGEKALGHLEHAHGRGDAAERGPYGAGSFAKPFLPGEEPAE